MKRCDALAQLSREHHAALVLAKRAQQVRPAMTDAVAAFMAGVVERFEQEVEPHFRIEETSLLPALRRAGCGEVAARALADHETLRALIASIRRGDLDSLCCFGDLLASHVRFEERELFQLAEAVLEPQALALVGSAAQPQGIHHAQSSVL